MTEPDNDAEIKARNEATSIQLAEDKSALLTAKALVDDGNYEEGLSRYLSALKGEVGYACNFFLRDALKELLQKFPTSQASLESKRNEMEDRLRQGLPHSSALEEEWMELNIALGDRYREVELLQKLSEKNRITESRTTIIKLLDINFSKYLQDKRYDVIEPHTDYLGRVFFGFHTIFESNRLFPKGLFDKLSAEYKFESKRIIQRGLPLFELCLALNREGAAKNIAQKLLDVTSSYEMFYKLLLATRRVDDRLAYDEIMEKAEEKLPYTEMKKLRTALKALIFY